MSTLQIVQLLFTLKAELAVLQKELLALENASTSAVVNPAPIGFAPWVPPATQPTHSQTPSATTPETQSQPFMGAVATTTPETLGSVYINPSLAIYANEVGPDLCVVIFDQNGNPITDASATITTDSLTNSYIPGRPSGSSWTPIGSYTYGPIYDTYSFAQPDVNCQYQTALDMPFQDARGYDFRYAAPSVGAHYFNISALGSSLPLTVEAIPYP